MMGRSSMGKQLTGNRTKKMAGGGAAQSGQRAERGSGSANSVGASRGSSSAGSKSSSASRSSAGSKSSGAAKSLAPATSARPAAKPSVVAVGSGKDKAYLDTRTGVKTAAPSYGAFSLKGLTSSDPANVARNRAGVERLNRLDAQREMGASRGEGVAARTAAAVEKAKVAEAVKAAPVVPNAPTRVYTPAPMGYRPGVDPEWNYYQAAPAPMRNGGKVKPKGKK